jgi:urease accessory protein
MTEGLLRFLTSLQHADTLFPSGGFAFSQGIEASLAVADRVGPFRFHSFADAHLRHRWFPTDRVAIARAHRAGGDLDRVASVDLELDASSISEDLREGSRSNGMSLLTGHQRLATPGAAEYRDRVRRGEAPGHLAVVQGLLWRAAGLDERSVVAVSGYQTVASLAGAAMRLGAIGAIDAQSNITRLLPVIEQLCREPVRDDQPFAGFLPMAEIASAMNRRSDLRMFKT